MTRIAISDGRIEVDAETVAQGLHIDAEALREGMREGTITSRFERGEGEDEGRLRVTFFSSRRRLRITADQAGNVLSCSAVDYTKRPPL